VTLSPPAVFSPRDRTYSIVFAVNESIARACGLYDPDFQMFLAFNDTYNYGLLPTRMPSLIYREVLGSGDRSLVRVREACTAANRCHDGNFIRDVMGDTYPQLDVWQCDPETGQVTVLA
jgi:hypothetical protein